MTYQIHIGGIVQGVGFRPMVFALAKKYRIQGNVSNSSEGVIVQFNAEEALATSFYQSILSQAPANSKIVFHELKMIEEIAFNKFEIIDSVHSANNTVLVSSDFGLCIDCMNELHDLKNRRYQYPFITCTQCGPRYSIIEKLPYDRCITSMNEFVMCHDCEKEYKNVNNRRFYSQTNSCKECGVKIELDLGNHNCEKEKVIEKVLQLLQEGKTVAVKGIGGYLLLCDATNEHAIRRLREKKHRPSKPFAVLYPTINILKEDVWLQPEECKALESAVAPIVLVRVKTKPGSGISKHLIAPGLQTIGVMLPYAPLLHLIAVAFNKPLIATSANISNSPIVYKDNDAKLSLFTVADAVLSHNRNIIVPQDDSVVRFTDTGRRIILRRSRGLAPSFFSSNEGASMQMVAMGAQLKSTVSLQFAGNTYVSQYIGDLESADTEENYNTILNHLVSITGAIPELVLTDLHPEYSSSRIGEQLAKSWRVPIERIQHHEAHFAAVLAENDLLRFKNQVLGVIWDGVGLGTDGHSWGGEFFIFNNDGFSRINHLHYFSLLLGDKMAKEPRLSAIATASSNNVSLLKSRFTKEEWKIYAALLKSEQLKTSSMGRLFDAVSCWCGLADKATYEGEASLLLEEAATTFIKSQSSNYFFVYPIKISNDSIEIEDLLNAVVTDVSLKVNPNEIAARFHCTLVNLVRRIAEQQNLKIIAFSGGVFQNALLVNLLERHLSGEYKLFFHQQLSPNDECISFGQLAYWRMKNEVPNKKNNNSLNAETIEEELFTKELY
jgi:hydrogenase maturation protein HypF